MVKCTDEIPLLARSSSNISSDDRRQHQQGFSSGENKAGLMRLFSRHRPITPPSKPLTAKTRKTVDTRALIVDKGSSRRKPGPMSVGKKQKNASRPQPLRENKKDSQRKQRSFTSVRKSPKSLNDPTALDIDLTPVVSQGDSITGCSQTAATSQSDAGENDLRAFHSLGGSTSQDDHSFFPASFDATENSEGRQGQHASPLSSNYSSAGSFVNEIAQKASVRADRTDQSVSQQIASVDCKVTESADVLDATSTESIQNNTLGSISEEVEISSRGEVSTSFEVSYSSPDKPSDVAQVNSLPNKVFTSEGEEFKRSSSPSPTMQKSPLSSEKIPCENGSESPAIVATVSKSPLNEPVLSSKEQSSQSNIPAQSKRPLSKTKALLSRPFGRSSLPPEIIRKWVVEVSPAEWDADESQWKYRLLIQSRYVNSTKERKKNPAFLSQQSFTTAFTWRSIDDFFWLAESLQQEYHGGLLLPDLRKVLRGPMKGNIRETPVEGEKLRNWLGDVLNGIRGQGELVMDYEAAGILSSESMEAFLYRSSGPASFSQTPTLQSPTCIRSPEQNKDKATTSASFVERFFSPHNIMLSPFAACADTHDSARAASGDMSTRRRAGLLKQIDAVSCQSSALLGDQSFDRQDSFASGDLVIPEVPTHYSILIKAERDLILNYRATARRTTEKLNRLIEEEEKVGYAWSVLTQSLAMLIAFEKDFEGIHIRDLKLRRENMPYRRLDKSVVDDSLESFSKARIDRALPSLTAFGAMLSAFVDDLDSIEPSVNAYINARTEISKEVTVPTHTTHQTWEDKIKDLAFRSFSSYETQEDRLELRLQREVEKNRLLKNETILNKSLTTFCHGVPIRLSRMAWRYLNTEATQCALLHSASVTLRKHMNVANEKSVAKMVTRHIQQERQDSEAESTLLQKILDLASQISSNQNTERIFEIARDCFGRWDATLARALLEEFGIFDSEIRMKEVSRDLEMIRKYACGLRESLNNCTDSLHQLRKVYVGGRNKSRSSLEAVRDDFFVELANLFSGTFVNVDNKYSEQRKEILDQVGIDTSDPFRWKRLRSSSQRNGRTTFTQGSVGNLVNAYFVERDSRIEWILDRLTELLQEYFKQVEVAEGFIYMVCVGTEVEKFFSSKRADMLIAFEKKTDITAAINVAIKKGLSHLVSELQMKLDEFGPDVSQTKMKEIKAAHLVSKEIKSGLHELAMMRLIRSREASTEKVTALIEFLSREEENSSTRELKALGEAMAALERSVGKEDFDTVVYKLSKKRLDSGMS